MTPSCQRTKVPAKIKPCCWAGHNGENFVLCMSHLRHGFLDARAEGQQSTRVDTILKLVLAPNEGTMKELLVESCPRWRYPDFIIFKESKRQMEVPYKGTD